MRQRTITSITKLLAASAIATTALQADILVVFQDVPDLGNLLVTNSANSDTVPVNELTTPVSVLEGDALRQWDFDSAGRTTLRYRPDTGVNAGIQLSFDAYIDAASTGNNLVRIGNDVGNLAGIKGAGVSIKLGSDGSIAAETADTVNGGWASQTFSGVATVATPFSVSAVFNAAVAGDLVVPVGAGQLTLAPQTWALFVDDALIATDLAGLSATSTGDATWTFIPANGAQDIWWLTGGASAESGMDFQYDNILIKTGADIGIVPEPSTTALALGGLILGFALFRRFRRR